MSHPCRRHKSASPNSVFYDLSRPESRRINANLRITYESASGVVTNQDILVDHYYSNGKEAVMHALRHGRDGERTFLAAAYCKPTTYPQAESLKACRAGSDVSRQKDKRY